MFYLRNIETGKIKIEDITNSFLQGNYPEILCWFSNDNLLTLVAERPFEFKNVLRRIEEMNGREINEDEIEKHYSQAIRIVLCDGCACNTCGYKQRNCCYSCLRNDFENKKGTLCKDAIHKLLEMAKEKRERNPDFRLNTDLYTYYEEIKRNNIANNDELSIAIALNGLSVNTLNNVIKFKTGSKDLEQWRLKYGNKNSRIRS